MFDILNISEPQARVLKAIAHLEFETGKKGVSQYNCIGNKKKFHVANSTFSDQIKKLQLELMVWKLIETDKSKPFTITDIGQIAWLRHYPIDENLEIISKMFPNIFSRELSKIIEEIDNPIDVFSNEKIIQVIFKEALNHFHINNKNENFPYTKFRIEEIITFSSYNELVETSYKRYYNFIHSKVYSSKIKELDKKIQGFSPNYDKLIIKINDRIEFLFYYILIQTLNDVAYMTTLIIKHWPLKTKINDTILENQIKFAKNILRKKKSIIKIITNNKSIQGNIKNNLAQLEEYHNTEFEQFYKLFFK